MHWNTNMSNTKHQSPIRLAFLNVQIVLVAFLILGEPRTGEALRIKTIQVPAAVTNGSQVSLICLFDLERDQLYSVKWYRNYVEFYRYELLLDQANEPANNNGARGDNIEPISSSNNNNDNSTNQGDNYKNSPTFQNGDSSQAASSSPWQAPDSKREFELEGISLNLNRSNATHVYLKQVTLASEGMYRCEVSSDQPSFVTVSAERQMKVYGLPKNRLTIVENLDRDQIKYHPNGQAIGPLNRLNSNNNQRASNINQNNMGNNQISKYQLNDLINLTCVSSPSFPQMQLTWFLNDQPIVVERQPSFKQHLSNNASIFKNFQLISSSSGVVMANNASQPSKTVRLDPVESRLTLSFRLEPKLLRHLAEARQLIRGRQTTLQAYNLINLSCRARMRISYQSEASILLSGGQAPVQKGSSPNNIGKQQQNQLSSSYEQDSDHLPNPLSLSAPDSTPDTSASNNPALINTNNESMRNIHQIHFRWPSPGSNPKFNPNFQHQQQLASFITNSQIIDQLATEESSTLSPVVLLLGSSRPTISSVSSIPSIHPPSLTKAEFQNQVHQISSLLRQLQPNELENPVIQASSVQSVPQPNEAQPETVSSQEYSDFDSTQNSRSNVQSSANVQKLTCNARLGQPIEDFLTKFASVQNGLDSQPGKSQLGDPDGPVSVNFKWLINKQELKTNQVNDYDKSRGFYNSQSQQAAATTSTTAPNRSRLASSPTQSLAGVGDGSRDHVGRRSNANGQPKRGWVTRQMETTSGLSGSSVGDDAYNEENSRDEQIPNVARKNLRQNGYDDLDTNKNKATNLNYAENKTLWIDQSPSILQLKELNVVCQTTIEQTIIEFETNVTIAYNVDDHHPKQPSNFPQIARGYQSPTSRINNQQSDSSKVYRNKNGNSNPNNRLASSTSASSSTTSNYSDIEPLIIVLTMMSSVFSLLPSHNLDINRLMENNHC